MRVLRSLFLICGLVGLALFAPPPARAQSDTGCLTDSGNLRIKPDIILDCLRAGQPISLDGVTVEGDLDLTTLNADSGPGIIVPGPLMIRNSHFTGSLLAFDGDHDTVLIFQESVDLRGSQFDGNVDFTGSTFEEFVHFENTRFEAGANFTQAAFQNGAYFRSAIFNDSTSFMLAGISGGIDFSDAQFFGLTNFSMLHTTQSPDPLFQTDVSFSGAHFTGEVFFMEAVFENPAFFNDAVFHRSAPEDMVRFTNATFTTLDLTNASFENGQLDLSGQQYKTFKMPNFHPSILATQNTVDGLSALQDNFRDRGNLDIANEIAYWQSGLQRKEKSAMTQILEMIFLDWAFGYGLKPLRSVVTSVILILFFAIFYYPDGALRPTTFAPSKPREQKFTIRLSELPIVPGEESAETPDQNQRSRGLLLQLIQVWRAVAFSFSVFTKLSSGKYMAVNRAPFVVTEWIVGTMVMAGFLLSVANTNPLLRSILDLFK